VVISFGAPETVQGKGGVGRKFRPTARIHDLRDSYASHLVSRGASLHVVGKLLGHTQAPTTMRYAHLQDAALRDATHLFGELANGGRVA
jgi:site-specific recombinase XerD